MTNKQKQTTRGTGGKGKGKGKKTCPMCPKTLRGKQEYCSDACKSAAYRARKKREKAAA